jgi:iron complex outermembrane receptor protein
VEVLRGPAAATYGPDAMGGVVHLITRTAVRERLRPEATGEAAEGQTTRGRVGGVYGDYGTYDLHGSLRHAEGRTTASAAFARQASRGAPVFGDSTALRYDDGSRLRLDFARTVGTAAVHRRLRRLGGASVYARLGVDDRDFSAYRFYSDFASDRAREATSTGWLHLRLAGPAGGRTRWRVQGAGRVHRDRYRFTPTARANEHVSALGSWQGQVAHDLGARLTLTGGGAVRLRGIDSNNMGVHDDLSGGAFAQGRWRPTQALTLSGSARATYDPYFGLEVTPQLFGAYLASSRVTVRGGIGRAVRAPTYVELFFNQFTKTPSGPNRGNANLVAERAWSAEAGVDVAAARGVMLHATAFGRRTHDLIDYATLSGTESLFRARNLHTVTTRGLELEAVLDRPVLGALVADPADRPALRLALAYTGLDATLEPEAGATPADSIDYKYALTNARHLVQATATVRVRRLRVGVQGLWRENLEAAAAGSQRYGVVHARMRYGFGRIRQTPLIVTAEMRNVFDTAYATPLGTPLPARTLLVGLELVL